MSRTVIDIGVLEMGLTQLKAQGEAGWDSLSVCWETVSRTIHPVECHRSDGRVLGKPWGKVRRRQNSTGSSEDLTGKGNSISKERSLVGRWGRRPARRWASWVEPGAVEVSPQGNSSTPKEMGAEKDPIRHFRPLAV